VAVGLIAFSPLIEQTPSRDPLGFLAILPLLWAALRRGPRDTATVALVLSGITIWGTLTGVGPFATANLNGSLLLLLMFFISITVPSLSLSADVAVRKKTEENMSRAQIELERKVLERTQELELSNAAKSRFLAVASHDLRQPLHALGLFVGQLRSPLDSIDRDRIVERIDTAVVEMNELFNALLDIYRLDAGALTANLTDFPIAHLLRRLEATFTQTALKKGLRLRVMPSGAWVRSDIILLERILLNFVSNAVRYTSRGGVLIGCRRRREVLHIEVWDSGPGIREDQQQKIFGEFYQRADSERDRHGGLGLGLAIVERLRRLLEHPVELTSIFGRGSRFTIVVPVVAARQVVEPVSSAAAAVDRAQGKLVVVIDDDALVLEGTAGLLRSWGCRVVTAASHEAALSVSTTRADSPAPWPYGTPATPARPSPPA
jgi:signal transduction histidine kinase